MLPAWALQQGAEVIFLGWPCATELRATEVL